MSSMTIRGSEYPIEKIFCDDFVFTIPPYQRAYSWTTEESEELLHDVMMAMEDWPESVDELAPYFLGSIVLIKKDEKPDVDIVDGQQRLVTLTMLLAALRSLSTDQEFADGVTNFLCQKGNRATRKPERYRLTLRQRDARFFQEHIQEAGGIEKLKQLINRPLTESQKNIRDNTLGFLQELEKLTARQREQLSNFILSHCFLILVSVMTTDLDSAYRIFSVLNSRGRNLTHADILKGKIIDDLPQELQDDYATKWERLEELLGDQLFEQLFSYLRTIASKSQIRRGLMEEFQKYVYPANLPTSPQRAQTFIDDELERYAYALNYIAKANYPHTTHGKKLNTMFKWLNQLDNREWLPPVMYYLVAHPSEPDVLLRFLYDFERLIVGLTLCKVPPYKRRNRYCKIVDAIYRGHDLYTHDSPLQLTDKEREEFAKRLNGDIYRFHQICRYILLRLDERLSDGTASYDYETITIEHVLPRRPPAGSEWARWFPNGTHSKYINRLGNLVLLSRGKNHRAENADFQRKKNAYFTTTNGGSTPFVLTNQVLRESVWTPNEIEARQRNLLKELKCLWCL